MLFDTSILISHLRGKRGATDLLRSVPVQERCVGVLARVEIEGGMRSPERSAVAELFATLRLVPVTEAIARRAGEHLRRYRRSHQGIDLVDYVIAATAELRRTRLATLNKKHFPMFPDLQAPW